MSSRFAVKEKRSFIQKTIIYDATVLSFYECKVDGNLHQSQINGPILLLSALSKVKGQSRFIHVVMCLILENNQFTFRGNKMMNDKLHLKNVLLTIRAADV